jgi:alkaline phosphatase
VKTTKNRIATDPDGNELESISYVLQREGYNVALMSSSPVNHATEASFFAKEETRNNFYEITKTIPETGFQFFGGSGFIQFYGKDGQQESSAEYLERNGYEVCCGAEEFEAAAPDCDKIVLYQECFRDTSATDYVMDGRKPAGEIELPQMMKYALDFIGDEKPFFVMCEQGTIDWAAHLNRVLPMVNAVIEFDDAIKVAYEFYLQHPDETLIVVTSDHGTGGPAIGAGGWGRDMVFWDKIEQSWNDLGQCNDLDDASNMALNESATIGWTTIYHTGECVPVYAIGKGAERFGGKIDNTEIKGKLLAL